MLAPSIQIGVCVLVCLQSVYNLTRKIVYDSKQFTTVIDTMLCTYDLQTSRAQCLE